MEFWSRVAITEGCWLWCGPVDSSGYGKLRIRFGFESAHRMAWRVTHGPIPRGQFVLHRCDTPPCVRPDHLFLGTQGDNMRDMVQKGRARPRSGEANGQAKLTEADALAIVTALQAPRYGLYSELARKYGVTSSLIRRIARGELWRKTVPATVPAVHSTKPP